MEAITTIGLDIAKSVFQVHGVDAEGKSYSDFSPRSEASGTGVFSASIGKRGDRAPGCANGGGLRCLEASGPLFYLDSLPPEQR